MGTPVIVSDACAGREAVEDGVTGLWFESGDAASLADAMTRLKDDALVARLSAQAYDAYWRAPATLDRHIEETLKVYDRMLSRKG